MGAWFSADEADARSPPPSSPSKMAPPAPPTQQAVTMTQLEGTRHAPDARALLRGGRLTSPARLDEAACVAVASVP